MICKPISHLSLIRTLTFLIVLLFVVPVYGQKKKSKTPYARGTMFGHWGYNRAFYTKSTIQFEGSGFDFEAKGLKAQDSPGTFNADYFNPLTITKQQYNARLGYYVRNYWAVSIGIDHLKYVMNDGNVTSLTGNVGNDMPPGDFPTGNVLDTLIVTDKSIFHYANSVGLNNISIEVTRSDPLWASAEEKITASTHYGLRLGGLVSFNNFRYGGIDDERVASFSGYAVSANFGLRLEFLKHLYLQANVNTGFMHQVAVRTRINDPGAFARHAYGFAQLDLVFGFLLYLRPTNDCNSCPRW